MVQVTITQNETPSEQVIKKAGQTSSFKTSSGRDIVIRKLSAMDRLNLCKVADKYQGNEGVMGFYMTAFHVVSIDGETVQKSNQLQVEATLQILGDEVDEVSMKVAEMVAEGQGKTLAELQEAIKNSQGTQTS